MNLLQLAERIGVDGFLHCEELQKLVELAAGRDVLEVGCYRGLSAWGMGFVARSLTCVDTFKAATDGQRQMADFTTLDAFKAATSRYSHLDVLTVPSEEAPELLGERTFDMIFLDAMHDAENVRADIQRWWPRLRMGGVFAMHDYRHQDFPGVEEAADEAFGPAADGSTVVTLRWIERT